MSANTEDALRNVCSLILFFFLLLSRTSFVANIWSVDFRFCLWIRFLPLFRRYFWSMDEYPWYDTRCVCLCAWPAICCRTHFIALMDFHMEMKLFSFFSILWPAKQFPFHLANDANEEKNQMKYRITSSHIHAQHARSRACLRTGNAVDIFKYMRFTAYRVAVSS